MSPLPRYDPTRTYEWNYAHAPDPVEVDVPPIGGSWSFCGLPVPSPLGIPAGPLLNGRWCLYYASLGFDVLTYKTVRSRSRVCYPLPNLQPVGVEWVDGGQDHVPASRSMKDSWAISFGMPSADPKNWMEDVENTRKRLAPEKRLVVSVVGSIEPGWSIDDLASDYAKCASWAVDSGADAIELNFSCPNVSTSDGQLYQNTDDACTVAQSVRNSIGQTPLIIKIGRVTSKSLAAGIVQKLDGIANALSMVNCISARVVGENGSAMFEGCSRGIGGRAIRRAALEQIAMFHRVIQDSGAGLRLIGVGGISTTGDVADYLRRGAESVQIATAAMLNPAVALEIFKNWPVD